MKWAWLLIRVVLSLLLGFLGPRPDFTHVDGVDPEENIRAFLHVSVKAYALSCIVAFLLLTLLDWGWRRLARELA